MAPAWRACARGRTVFAGGRGLQAVQHRELDLREGRTGRRRQAWPPGGGRAVVPRRPRMGAPPGAAAARQAPGNASRCASPSAPCGAACGRVGGLRPLRTRPAAALRPPRPRPAPRPPPPPPHAPHLGLRRPVQLVLLGPQAELDLGDLRDVLGLDGLRNHDVRGCRRLHVEQRLHGARRRRRRGRRRRRSGRHGCRGAARAAQDQACERPLPMGEGGEAGGGQINGWGAGAGGTASREPDWRSCNSGSGGARAGRGHVRGERDWGGRRGPRGAP
jgi:hypothetical protein